MPKRLASRVLLIGWDAADWQLIDPLLQAGLMPTLKTFLDTGVRSSISTLLPILSPMLWTSIATGKHADKHGIHGFVEPRPDGQGIQLVSSTSRKTHAIWNILNLAGFRSNVVGWYASDPAEPIRGVMVSESVGRIGTLDGEMPPLPPSAVSPGTLYERVAELRVSPREMSAGHVGPFVPTLGQVPHAETGPLAAIAQMLARAGTVHNVITDLLEHEPWDFATVYYDAIDHFGHGFMEYHPPKMAGTPPHLFERYRGVMNACYRFHDMMLERLLTLAGDETTVILVSDHGFMNGHRRPIVGAGKNPGAEAWHREHGILAMRGPGIRKGVTLSGITLLDIAPTILALFGLPVGRDMDGRVLREAFDQPVEVERIPSWDAVKGDAGTHPPDLRIDAFEGAAAIEQLVDLGYLARPSENHQAAVALARNESRFNLAGVYLHQERSDEACGLLEAVVADKPGEVRYLTTLARAQMLAGRFEASRQTILRVPPESDGTRGPLLEMILSILDFSQGNQDEALAHLHAAERAELVHPTLPIQMGNLYLRRRQWDDAARLFAKALAVDPQSPLALYGLGCAALHKGDAAAAVDLSLRALEAQPHFPRGHLQLGIALVRLGEWEKAEKAFLAGLQQRPGMVAAHRFLSRLYLKLGRADLAKGHGDLFKRMVARGKIRPEGPLGHQAVGPLPTGDTGI